MPKEISRQLCEIVKLTQKYALFGNRHTVATEEKIKEYSKEIDYPEGAWVEVYPDFGQPENFVKLQTLIASGDINMLLYKAQEQFICELIDFDWYDKEFRLKHDDFDQCISRTGKTVQEALINSLHYALGGEATDNPYNNWIPQNACISFTETIQKTCEKFENIEKSIREAEWKYE